MDNNQDADEILKAIQKKDSQKKEGKLKIFFGMSAGVGKTYAMLQAAHQKIKENYSVIIGTIDTHGRPETLKLTENIPFIPRKKFIYKDVELQEMDLDTILQMRPQIVLVDELAHSNAPGSRHPKRFQDVIEILANGIDVYTTLNVQHVESRKDDVQGITGIMIRETVPDSILDRADSIELIDLPAYELLQRLREGNVYLGDKAREAEENFFKEDKLMALREISLRVTADKVDRELRGMLTRSTAQEIWKTNEKLLVAIGHGPYSEKLIRETKKLSEQMSCPWIGLYVDTGVLLSEEDKNTVERNLNLSRELGGLTLTTSEVDLVQGIDRISKQYQVTQIIIGKPGGSFLRSIFSGGNVIERLNQLENNIAIHIIRNNEGALTKRNLVKAFFERESTNSSEYIFVCIVLIFISALSYFIHHYFSLVTYRSVGFIFLLCLSILGSFVSLWPTLLASVISVSIWNFFFIPPLYTFRIGETDDVSMWVSFVIVSLVNGILATTLKKNQKLVRAQEQRTTAFYQISKAIVESKDRSGCFSSVCNEIDKYLEGKSAISIRGENQTLEHFKKGEDWLFNRPKEWAVASWSFDNRKMAGHSTSTLPNSESIYFPLTYMDETLGILAFSPTNKTIQLGIQKIEFLKTVSTQLAIYIQKEISTEKAVENDKLKESEKLHQTLLNLVSHELKTPLTSIAGPVQALREGKIKDQIVLKELLDTIYESSIRLKSLVDNILDMSRLSSEKLQLKFEWCDINDLIQNASTKSSFNSFEEKLKINISADFPLIYCDGKLIEMALFNLFQNAAKYGTDLDNIFIEARCDDSKKYVMISVKNAGPEISFEHRKHIFDKFYRIPGSNKTGMGLGLTIVKSVVDLHQGKILYSFEAGMNIFTLYLNLMVVPQSDL